MKKLDWNYLYKRWNHLRSHKTFQKSPMQAIWRTGLWSFHCLFGIPATVKLPRWDCCFFLPPKFRRAGSTGIFVTREDYEPELAYLEHFLSPGKVFIDGGANFGIYTVVAAKLVGKSGVVISFEPGLESFSILKRNVKLNNLDNAKILQMGLSDREGKTRFYHIDRAPNSYSLGTDSQKGTTFEEISITTIGSILAQQNIQQVDMIKLDVEGAEELALRGAKSVIQQMRPTILFEVSERATRRLGLSLNGTGEFLKELGYKFFAIESNGTLISLNFPKIGNNLAIPTEKSILA